ncbi:MAG: porin [Gammaproteobacteria bacterium]|nr:MAG: porin [Gammaproteobacteria bacterium]
MKKVPIISAVSTALTLSFCSPIWAQESSKLDIGRFVIAGYGDVSYVDTDDPNANSNVESRFVPIFLFQLSEKIHIESELEFSIGANGETEVEMEYADIHYFLNDNTTITAGKFLLPFGQFGPNLHPSWINKLPATPGLYGHGGNGSLTPLISILSDTGVNVRNSFKIGSGKLFTDFYVVSGPREEEEEAEDGELVEGGHGSIPEVGFESGKGDNNSDKAFGGRVAYAFLPSIEVGYSFYNGAYSNDASLDYSATAIDFNWIGTYASVRGEIIETSTDFLDEDDGEIDVFDRGGWYVQGSWQMRQLGKDAFNPVELVLRYSEINDALEGERWTVGMNYWLGSSAALKIAYEDTTLEDGDTDNRIFVQLAFGF